MFTGKNSALKGFSLLAMIGVVILDLIANSLVMGAALHEGALSSKWLVAVPWINFIVTAGVIGMLIYDLYTKWSKESE